MLDLSRINFYLKLSRPIIWIIILPYYLFPLGGRLDLLATWRFWLGLLYFTFPVNIMMFGINDMADADVDKHNPRKFLKYYGNQATDSDLVGLWKVILVSNLIPILIISITTGDWVLYPLFLAVALGLNILYNFEPFAFARKAPWDLPFNPVGMITLVLFACHLNRIPSPRIGPCVFYVASAVTNQMLAELADIDSDALGGKRTTAVVIGKAYTCAFIGALILVQLLILTPLSNIFIAMLHCGGDASNLATYIKFAFFPSSVPTRPWEGSPSFFLSLYLRYTLRVCFVVYALVNGTLAS
ncbi:hypothetical protein FOZ63_023921 [Perkinsus olseni]|uniref:Prenyltransferase n=1 Tax=Perkinsus olseni TaxID=32597 RepID=A0A7J6PAY3_PEROL|nr:hypothetical protein FOZ63_023921 [Perkinsus olseni]